MGKVKTTEEISQYLESERVTYRDNETSRKRAKKFHCEYTESEEEHDKRIAAIENEKWVPQKLVEELKKRLYDKLMPDISGKTQKAIEEAFSETFAGDETHGK